MKRIFTLFITLSMTLGLAAQGWPENYGGVMLQGFYWESYNDTQWTRLEKQADDLATTFDLVWLPQSGNCGGTSMGYDDLYWFPGGTGYSSSFGNEEELRSLIKTFKDKGIGTIADVVINHRKNVSNWVDFPKETYNGVIYQLLSTDIVADDYWYDDKDVKHWTKDCDDAKKYPLGPNNDTGEGWAGMRDLDHNSENVQSNVKAYVKMLLEDLGYAGFRYDMVKGYGAKFTKLYNEEAKPTFSVGEYWDGNATTVKNWINDTGKTSAAFDFPFRYTVRNALRGSSNDYDSKNWNQDANFALLGSSSLVSDVNYRQYAVTFVENHDTERRNDAEQDPIRKDTLAANAFLLAMPGTPCVFLKHWKAYKKEIANMVTVRKAVGITNTSAYQQIASQKGYFAVSVTGTNGKLLAVVGTNASNYTPDTEWKKAVSGYHYAYYVSGIEPESIKYPEFAKSDFKPYTITVNVNADLVGWTGGINFWTWGGDGSHSPVNTKWPGDKITQTVSVGGKTWYTKQYTINDEDDAVYFVFSTGTGSPQTVNVSNVSTDKYFEISTEKEDSHYKVNDVTSEYSTGISPIVYGLPDSSSKVYTLDGRLVNTDGSLESLPKGIYIIGNKKFIRK